MNKIYRTVWSDTLQTWVAVAETAPAKGKRASSKVGGAAAALIAATIAAPAMADGMHGVPALLNSRLTDGAPIGMAVGAVQQLLQQPAQGGSAQSQTVAALSGIGNTLGQVTQLDGDPLVQAVNTVQQVAQPVKQVVASVKPVVEKVVEPVAKIASTVTAPLAKVDSALVGTDAVRNVTSSSSSFGPAAPAVSLVNNIAPGTLGNLPILGSTQTTAATPMAAAAALPPPQGSVAPPINPPAPTGLVIGTGGLLGGVSQGLAPLTLGAFNSQNEWLRSGALAVNRENLNARFRVVNVLGLPVLDLAPVTGALAGGGGLSDQRLTLLGGVTSGNYITNINNGLTYNNGLLLPNTPPPGWVQQNNCLNVLGIAGATCWDVPAAQNNQVLIGDGASANGSQEVVIGTDAKHLLPNENASDIFTDPSMVGVPDTNYAARKGHSVVIGDSAFGNANGQTILGANASSTVAGGVALGFESVADRVGGGVEAYSKVAVPVRGAVSVGSAGNERQITNVAGGTADTDAVNLRQLKALETTIGGVDANSVKYDDNSRTKVTLAGGAAGTKITNVAKGTVSDTSTDAVNGSQLNETNTNVTNVTNKIVDIDVAGTKYFRANSKLAGASATGTDSVAAGGASQASAANSVALGANANASQANSVALGAGSTTSVGAQTGYAAYGLTALQNSAGEVSVGRAGAERKITNVAAGSSDTDAANVAQLKAVDKQVTDLDQLAVKYDNVSKTIITLNSGGASTKITNVAKGAETSTSTDAVNGSQLWNWTQNTTNVMSNTSLYELIKNIQTGETAKYFRSNSTLAAAQATGKDSVAMGPEAVSGGANSVAAGKGATTSADNAVAMGGSSKATGTSSTAVGSGAEATGAKSTAMGAGSKATAANSVALGADSVADRANTVSVGSVGNERQITNVADGTEDTDAANIRQLKAVSGDVTNISNGKDGMFQVENSGKRAKPAATGTDSAAGGAGAVASGAASTAVGNDSQATGENSVAVGNGSKASGQNSTALSNGSSASGTNSIALGNNSQAAGNGGMALGNGAQAGAGTSNGVAVGNDSRVTSNNSVALGSGSVADRANTVSVGAAGSERQITNVAAGKADTDAVNVAQLRDATGDFGNQIDRLRTDMRGIERNANAGAASAMAVAGLPQAYAPGRSMASAAASHYLGQSAIALGVSTVSENGRWVYKIAGNVNTQGKLGAVIGAGYQW